MCRKLVIGTVICSIVLTSCCLKAGIVVGKKFELAHKSNHTQIIYMGKTAVPVSHTRNIPDKWYLLIADEENPKHRCWVEVSQVFYDRYEVGSYYKAPRKEIRSGR